jgi:hypothetical protein
MSLPESWAIVTIPAAINSTIAIPKCSYFIVWIAAFALEKISKSSSLFAPILNSIVFSICNSLACCLRLSTIA